LDNENKSNTKHHVYWRAPPEIFLTNPPPSTNPRQGSLPTHMFSRRETADTGQATGKRKACPFYVQKKTKQVKDQGKNEVRNQSIH